jgi:hypothetical protein
MMWLGGLSERAVCMSDFTVQSWTVEKSRNPRAHFSLRPESSEPTGSTSFLLGRKMN